MAELTEIRFANHPDMRADRQPDILLYGNSLLFSDIPLDRQYHLGSKHPGAKLRGSVETGQLPLFRFQQIESFLRHVDLPKTLGYDQGNAFLLIAGDGDAEIIAEKITEVFIIETADNDADGADRNSLFQPFGSYQRAADYDASLAGAVDFLVG